MDKKEQIEFIITKKQKKKALKRRIFHEKAYVVPVFLSAIFLIFGIVFAVLWIKTMVSGGSDKETIYNVLFIASAMISVIVWNVMGCHASDYISENTDERIWIEDGCMYHFFQGKGFGHTGDASVYKIPLSSIRNLKYDPASGRLEFYADITAYYYENYEEQDGIVEEKLPDNVSEVIYEYMEPSLYKFLSNNM